MKLRDDEILILPWIANQGDPLRIAREIILRRRKIPFTDAGWGSISDQKPFFPMFALAIIEKWRDVWSATINMIQVQEWGSEIRHPRDIGLSLIERSQV